MIVHQKAGGFANGCADKFADRFAGGLRIRFRMFYGDVADSWHRGLGWLVVKAGELHVYCK